MCTVWLCIFCYLSNCVWDLHCVALQPEEDCSDEAYTRRHASLEASERIRFQGVDKKKIRNRQSSSVPTTPDAIATAPVSPAPSGTSLKSSPADPVSASLDESSLSAPSRKSSRKSSASRSTSSVGDLEPPTPSVLPWEPRIFPLNDAEVAALSEEQPSGRTRSAALLASTPGFNRAHSMPASLSGSCTQSLAGSPADLGDADKEVFRKASVDPVVVSPSSSWSVRTPSPKAIGKEVEESKPPLVLKLKKTGLSNA